MVLYLARWFSLSLVIFLFAGCAPAGESDVELPNQAGKEDATSVRLRLSESNPLIGMTVRCDLVAGCHGHVEVELRSPDACSILADPRCGVTGMPATSVELANLTIRSEAEGERRLPFSVSTADGDHIGSSMSAPFSARSGEEIEIELERIDTAPTLTVQVSAEWNTDDPGVEDLLAFLSSIPDLSYSEIPTAYAGYRAYLMEFRQPLDHSGANLRSISQRFVLHHRNASAPMILYTSGYALFEQDYLSELAESMVANQVSTEQRFFGASFPVELSSDDYQSVTIRQAAADHHRIVQALAPFYGRSWIGTGHSKGGMTAIYHRRFYPEDTDATVAYVAPISFETNDPRYVPFLDQIGTEECRLNVRDFQRFALEQFEPLRARLEQQAKDSGFTFEFAGSQAAAFEDAVVSFEWGFWQAYGDDSCRLIPRRADLETLSEDERYQYMTSWIGFGWTDQQVPDSNTATYHYQAAHELGYPGMARAHLENLLAQTPVPWWTPTGTSPEHDPAVMADIQQWVLTSGSEVAFVYGEYDPWTGGSFDPGESPERLHMVAPRADHGATIRGLSQEDRDRMLEAIERWTGNRPSIDADWTPAHAPLPARLLREPLYFLGSP